MRYCLSQAFNPISFVSSSKDDAQEESTLVGLIWTTEILFVLLGLYIIFKMCQLCSKAFSYSNFHIHEAYKFYTLALISTISKNNYIECSDNGKSSSTTIIRF